MNPALFLENVDKTFPYHFAFRLGVGDSVEPSQEFIRRVDKDRIGREVLRKQIHHLFGLPVPQKAVVHEYAAQAASQGAVEEKREAALPEPDCTKETLECEFQSQHYWQLLEAAREQTSPIALYWRSLACRELADIAFDPQTSGGLLIALPATESDALLAGLRAGGVAAATRIGSVANSDRPVLRLV